jgi:hypothetical protein
MEAGIAHRAWTTGDLLAWYYGKIPLRGYTWLTSIPYLSIDNEIVPSNPDENSQDRQSDGKEERSLLDHGPLPSQLFD